MQTKATITELRNCSQVASVQRSVQSDWIVITEPAAGPKPNPVEVFADHAGNYEITNLERRGDETFVHADEV
jgi:hypothetical protein